MNFWKNKKVLVTGGAGFIGSYLTELLLEEGAVVTVVGRAETQTFRIESVLKKVRYLKENLFEDSGCSRACEGQEIVMNLAGRVAGIGYNNSNMADMFEANMKLQMNVLYAAADAGVRRFLQVSSACIYPHDAIVPTPESEGERSEPGLNNEGYGFAKLMGEKLAKYYTKEKNIEVMIARPFNAYGPRDYFDQETCHVIPALVRRILGGENPVRIWGSGNQSRAFVHARDVAKGLMMVTEKAVPCMPVNIGHDQEVTIKQLFEIICHAAGVYPDSFFDTSKPDGYPRRSSDITLLKKITGFSPAISIEEGIRETVDWYREFHLRFKPQQNEI